MITCMVFCEMRVPFPFSVSVFYIPVYSILDGEMRVARLVNLEVRLAPSYYDVIGEKAVHIFRIK